MGPPLARRAKERVGRGFRPLQSEADLALGLALVRAPAEEGVRRRHGAAAHDGERLLPEERIRRRRRVLPPLPPCLLPPCPLLVEERIG